VGGVEESERGREASLPTGLISAAGRPTAEFREQLRRIPNARNAVAVASIYAQAIAIIVISVHFNKWYLWIAAFILMGRVQAQFAALMHEAAHRLLFRNRKANDFVGRWLLAFPSFRAIDVYRRGHLAHHRDFGPDDNDAVLQPRADEAPARRKPVPIPVSRRHQKVLARLVAAVRSESLRMRAQARAIIVCQLVLIAIGFALNHPWVYFILWLAPNRTVWRATNRMRSIAEHGGVQRAKDGGLITPTVRQTPVARFFLTPYNIGYHLAHHVDAGVPMANLPRLHAELKRSGHVAERFEFRNYTSLWRTLASKVTLDA
jgi:fatty acid desaturase